MHDIDLDEVAFIAFVAAIFVGPYLLALPWAWFTRVSRVRRRLVHALVVVASTLILAPAAWAFFDATCQIHGIEARTSGCYVLPDSLEMPVMLFALYGPLAYGIGAALWSLYDEAVAYRLRWSRATR